MKNNTSPNFFTRFTRIFLALLVLSIVGISGHSSADSTVTQTYNASSSVLPGMLVEPDGNSAVEPLMSTDVSRMSGVVVPIGASTFVLTSPSSASHQVLVANSGHYNLLVSTQNGPIKVGDDLVISSINGIAMKSDTTELELVGQALSSFNGKSGVLGSETLKNSSHSQTVNLGVVSANVQLMHNPIYKSSKNSLPQILSNAASNLANKPVSLAKVYLGALVIVLAFLISGIMLYGGVRSSISAIGRNPLSKAYVIRGLLQTVIVAIIVLVVGVGISFVLIKI